MTKERIKLLIYKDDSGFKKVSVTRSQLRLLHTLYLAKKLEGITFFDMREVSPIDEVQCEYLNIFNVDFSFTRVDNYFKEGLSEILIYYNDVVLKEYASIDRIKFLQKDSIERGYTYACIEER